MKLQRLTTFLTEPCNRKKHAVIIAAALIAHLFLHYATYIPALREPFGALPYFRLHVLHEAEFLFIVVYAALVFRLKGGLTAVAVTAVTSIPFILTPYIFGRSPRPDEIRDLAIQVAFILLMGTLITIFYEAVARGSQRRLALAAQLEATNNQLTGLNQMIQKRMDVLFDKIGGRIEEEKRYLGTLFEGFPTQLSVRYYRFLENTRVLITEPDDTWQSDPADFR